MGDPDVLRQREWTEEELNAAGFRYYQRRKQVVMARELTAEEAPKIIHAPWATLVAEAGAMIVYNPTYDAQPSIDDYEHWPVQPELFYETYAPWDEPDRTTTPAEMHLLAEGCKPYYKFAGAWARRLTEPAFIQSLESPEPILLPAGAWLCVGTRGEPWGQNDVQFRARYIIPEDEQHAAEGADRDAHLAEGDTPVTWGREHR